MKHGLRLPGLIACALIACAATAAEPGAGSKLVAVDCLPAQLQATFVLFDPATESLHVANRQRADQRFIPASTFKIANTLIGLETGAVRDVDEVLPYGGQPQWRPEWEHDMALREAIKLSAVPIYQELARRIGLERMGAMLRKLGYGNAEIGTVVDRFWLQGPLAISAIEQTRFLTRLVQRRLPVSAANLAAVDEITVQERTAEYVLHYKTGWAATALPQSGGRGGGRSGGQIGWVVGWLRRGTASYPFAFNMDIGGVDDLPKRWPLARACLSALGKLEPG